MKWKDARVKKPSSNSYDRYAVLYLYEGITFKGFAAWVPNGDYSDGSWDKVECTNGNRLGGEVLYWHEFLDLPSDIET